MLRYSSFRFLARNDNKMLDSLASLASGIQELLRHKVAGNEAFQAGKHSEAIEHYIDALSNVESRPFAAICFCNQAAAYKALNQVTDVVGDCSMAIALDGSYLKAISKRAILYEMIRDYGQASDLRRLVGILTKQVEEKINQSGSSDRSGNLANDLRQAHMRLSTFEEEARNEIPLDMYLILGIEPSASALEIKKAYRKAALRHHSDKAGQSLARTETEDDRLSKEIGEEIHKHADRRFKMIGEAYAVLSDHAKARSALGFNPAHHFQFLIR
ncbi:Heat shock protein DnaJ with tetratricopeptide repeat [Euphorbia peplus]|nr:Heat shock protein DnaJ with tetratricopeptide repeat [Euphorbia peplus]